MIAGELDRPIALQEGGTVDARSYASAILNILEDAAEETARLADTQRAALNILEDFDTEKKRVEQVNLELGTEIAERTRAEEALRHAKAAAEGASRELEAFSYSVAHDLRAPLRSIDGFSQALLEDCADRLDDDGRKYLRNVRESAQQMGALIDDLLNLSRVTRAELRREAVDLSALARSVLARLREAQPGREVEVAIEDGLVAQADPRLLEVVLTNLLGNAWKFTGRRPAARIEFGAEPGGHPTVYRVRDNGAGFESKYGGKLFGVFQRLHTAEEFEGTGIGLATVQRIVRRHGGRVQAEGEVDRGATFSFTLEGEGP
jgi:light-regulated signal transduction histidine kinase (bacteriophytochrome)